MSKRGALWIAVSVDLLDPMGNKFGLDDAAIMAYERGLAWCKRQGTEGTVPRAIASRFLNGTTAALEAAGLVALVGDQVVIPDWLKWNESAAQAAERRERQAKYQRRSRDLASKKQSSALLSEQSRAEQSREFSLTEGNVYVAAGQEPVPWNVTCRHGAPYNGRGCIECRTGKDLR